MVLYHGAMDYYVLKKDGKNVIILLDNHALEEYCKYSAQNIDNLFKDFLNNDDATIVLEEVIGNVNYKSIFNSKHLTIFADFYEKYKNNNNIISIDIRLLLRKNNNIGAFFGDTVTNDSTIINIKKIIDLTRKLYPIFEQHYQKLYSEYKSEYNNINNNTLNLRYPFTTTQYDKNESAILSGIMELYGISYILNSEKNNVILYLGAAHGVVICKLLMSYYNYEMKRNNDLRLEDRDDIYFKDFERLGTMCIDFIK